MSANSRIVKEALIWLSPKQKLKFIALIGLNSSLALLDLLGVAVFALLGTIAIRGIQSVNLSPRTKELIQIFNLENLPSQQLISLLAVTASVLLISKTLISISLNRRTQLFLSNTGAKGSAEYIENFLNSDLEVLETTDLAKLRFNATHGSRALFTGILGGFVTLITDGFLLIVMLSAIFFSSPLVALASTTIFVGAASLLHFIQRHKAFTLGTEGAERQLSIEQDLLASTQGFRELFVAGKIHAIIYRIERKFFDLARVNAEMSILPNVGKYVIEITLILGTLLVAAIQVTIADVARATSVMTVFLVAASRVAPALLRIQQGLLSIRANYGTAYEFIQSARRIKSQRLLHNQLVMPESRGEDHDNSVDFSTRTSQPNKIKFEPTVSMKSVSYSFPNSNKLILHNVTLQFDAGERVAIVGASGSGKSTLVDLMLGLREPITGVVGISGVSPKEAIKRWPGLISYAPQKTFLMKGSVTDNLSFFDADLKHDPVDLNSLMHILELSQRLEDPNSQDGYKLISDDLSGGETQRLGLARALYKRPRLLVIDEATSALDARLEKSIVGHIMEKDETRTVIAITHRVSTIKLASRIIFVSNGKITGDSSFDRLYFEHVEFRQQIDAMEVQSRS